MKRYGVFGGGLMGQVIAKDLVATEPDAEVSLFDVNGAALREAADAIGSSRFRTERADTRNTAATIQALRTQDVAVAALPHRLSLPLVQAAVEAGTSLVDLVGEAPEERAALSEHAREAGCLVVPGCGVAPGISNICVGQAASLLDDVHDAFIYVGGIPKRKQPPLFYETVYLPESVLNAYLREVTVVENGKEVTVLPLTGLETIRFPEPIGALEAFYTDGLVSLLLTMRGKVKKSMFEKTLRYPGHVERIRLLIDCGLLDENPVEVGGSRIAPRELLLKLLEDRLQLGPEGDVLAMRILVTGIRVGQSKTHTFQLIDYFDPETRYTAMARTTGFAAACTARMIAGNEILEKGVLFPEQIFVGPRFDEMVSALARKGVSVIHVED
jgi:lysine 6-dehydrogenase